MKIRKLLGMGFILLVAGLFVYAYISGGASDHKGRIVDVRNLQSPIILDGEKMLAIVSKQLSFGPRHLSASGHREVQDFLTEELKSYAHEVVAQRFEHIGVDGVAYELKNIVARFFPEKERRVILGTHYDSKKFADKDLVSPQDPVPGANDSASGTAVLLEIARVLSNSSISPEVGVDIVFFDGEEGEENLGEEGVTWSPLGSEYFAEHIEEFYDGELPIVGVVIDMVCDRDLKISQERTSVKNAKKWVDLFWDIAGEIDEGVFQKNIGQEIRDDHTALNRIGIPSFLVIDFEYPYFHTTQDTIDKCSGESLEKVGYAVLNFVFSM